MIKRLAVLVGPLLIAGCALPLPVQIASWALDGISYLATQKSMADHGLSLMAHKDCAIWRGVVGEQFCMDDVNSHTAIAAYKENRADTASLMETTVNAGVPSNNPVRMAKDIIARIRVPGDTVDSGAALGEVFGTANELPTDGDIERAADDSIEIRNLPVAAGRSVVAIITSEDALAAFHGGDLSTLGRDDAVDDATVEIEFSTAAGSTEEGEEGFKSWNDPVTFQPAVDHVQSIKPVLSADPKNVSETALDKITAHDAGGLYLVVGSFGYIANAKRVVEQFPMLNAAVLVANVGGRSVYRVVVGPFSNADKQAGQARIRDAGIGESWAISLGANWITRGQKIEPAINELASTRPPTVTLSID